MSAETHADAPRPNPARRRWTAIALSVLIFLSGVVVGGAGTILAAKELTLDRLHHPEVVPVKMGNRIGNSLGLPDEKTDQVVAILEERREAIFDIFQEFKPRLSAELDRMRTEVSAILDEKQAREWETRFDKLRNTWFEPLAQTKDESPPG
jgi:hypothetical protein